jgi:Bcr/CflA subfamily drug resistance transporter
MKNVQKPVPSLLIIIALVSFPQISESIFTPALPALSSALNVTAQTGQLTMSTYFIAFAVGVLFWGGYSDHVGRRPAMLGGLVIYLIGNLGLHFAPNFAVLIFFRLIQSFGASVGSVVTQSIMRESFTGATGAKVFANVGAALALSPAVGPLLGGIAQTYFGYRSVFSVLVAMAISLLLYTFYRLPETNHQLRAVPSWRSIRSITWRLMTDCQVWLYGLLISGINGILFSFYAEAPFIFINHFHTTSIQYGILGIIIALASILGSMVINRLVALKTPVQITKIGLTVALLGGFLMIGTSLFNSMLGLIFSVFIAFFGLYITLPMALNLALVGYEDVIGTASGIFSFMYYLIISFFTYLMSIFHTDWIGVLPIYITVIILLMTGSYYFHFKK